MDPPCPSASAAREIADHAAYRPQTNGKADRYIQSALREWAYGIVYNPFNERTAMLDRDES